MATVSPVASPQRLVGHQGELVGGGVRGLADVLQIFLVESCSGLPKARTPRAAVSREAPTFSPVTRARSPRLLTQSLVTASVLRVATCRSVRESW
jgi:hypothetical protein